MKPQREGTIFDSFGLYNLQFCLQMDVKLALTQMIGQASQSTELSEKDLVHKQKLCMEILNIANRISPGKYGGHLPPI